MIFDGKPWSVAERVRRNHAVHAGDVLVVEHVLRLQDLRRRLPKLMKRTWRASTLNAPQASVLRPMPSGRSLAALPSLLRSRLVRMLKGSPAVRLDDDPQLVVVDDGAILRSSAGEVERGCGSG